MSNIVFMIDYKTGKTTKKEYQYSIDSWKKYGDELLPLDKVLNN